MASLIALRAILGAGIGLGALDLVWLNLALAPAIIERPRIAAHTAPEPSEPPAAPNAVATLPPPAGIEAPAPSARPAGGRVYFASMSTALDPAARSALRGILARSGPGSTVVLEGHADYRGTEAFNLSLSKQRALVVGNYLERLGLPRTRLRIGFVGEANAVGTAELWRDRRVEIQIIGGP
jgi:outer membrane protein OmpA-like peptidoglycan-associated protein